MSAQTPFPEQRAPAPAQRRLGGIDVARAAAIFAMFAVHLGAAFVPHTLEPAVETVAHGRSSALFAFLAGLSLALMSGRTTVPYGAQLGAARAQIAWRAALLIVLGLALTGLGTPVSIIIAHYGGFLLLALPLLGSPVRSLLTWAAGLALAGPQASFLLRRAMQEAGWLPAEGPPGLDAATALNYSGLVPFLLTGMFPAATFMAFVAAGLAVGRMDLSAPRVRTGMVVAGAALLLAGHGGSRVGARFLADPLLRSHIAEHTYLHGAVPTTSPAWLLSAAPHSGTTFEIVGAAGMALLTTGLCLWAAERAPRLCAPLAAVGSMALTVYVAHVLGIWWVRAAGWWGLPHLAEVFTLATLAGAMLWRRCAGQGPLERVVSSAVRRFSAAGAAPRRVTAPQPATGGGGDAPGVSGPQPGDGRTRPGDHVG